METRSKTRVGQAPEPNPEPTRGTPETPVLRSSSESSVNLTVLMDDGGGDVGPGRPTVGAMTTSMTTSSESTLADQPRDAAGIDPVQEPMYDYGSNSDDTVTERHRAVAAPAVGAAASNPTLVSCSKPGVSGGVGQVPTMISGRSGVPVNEGVASAPISGKVGTLYDNENVLPRVHKSLSQLDNADDAYSS